MTQSTPPPDQGWSDRPATTDATPPPAPAWSAPESTSGAVAVARPGRVTAAAIVLIVLGALFLLFGLGALAVGVAGEAMAPGIGEMAGFLAGAAIVFAIILLALGVLQILSGAMSLGGRSWARFTGMIVALLMLLLLVLGLAGTLTTPGAMEAGGPLNLVINLVIAAAYAFVVWGLATSGHWFSARSA